jgi:type II secretion system protein H
MRFYHNKQGFSLIELIIVMVLMGIILGIGALNFNTWQRKAQIERHTRELMADLNTARTESIFRKKRHAIVINSEATGYVLRRYSSVDESRFAGTVINTKNVGYLMTKPAGTSIADRIFEFDLLGFTTDLDTIRFNPNDIGSAFDCIVVSSSRTNIGRMEGGSCAQK